jgi:hypothetical protein
MSGSESPLPHEEGTGRYLEADSAQVGASYGPGQRRFHQVAGLDCKLARAGPIAVEEAKEALPEGDSFGRTLGGAGRQANRRQCCSSKVILPRPREAPGWCCQDRRRDLGGAACKAAVRGPSKLLESAGHAGEVGAVAEALPGREEEGKDP